jgi:hypothetical protein
MRCVRGGDVLGALIAEIRYVDTLEQAFSGTEKDRRNDPMQFVDKART